MRPGWDVWRVIVPDAMQTAMLPPSNVPPAELEPAESLEVLAAIFEPRRAALPTLRISLTVLGDGPWILDTRAQPLLTPGMDQDADLLVVANAAALSDLVQGRLDASRPKAGRVFVWGGDDAAWRQLHGAIAGAKSWLDSKIAAVSARGRTTDARRKKARRWK